MDADEARETAARIEPDDPAQRAIIEATLRASGPEHVLRVAHFDGGQPPWQVLKDGNPLTFAGVFTYGGQTRSIALAEAVRVASKRDWRVEES